MRFQVPQFLGIEDKVFGGFLTFKQFLYLAGGGGMIFVLFQAPIPNIVALFLSVPVGAFALALAFKQHNSKPFIFLVESAFKYFLGKKLYTWKRSGGTSASTTPAVGTTYTPSSAATGAFGAAGAAGAIPGMAPTLGDSRLKDLTWGLDIQKMPTGVHVGNIGTAGAGIHTPSHQTHGN